MEWHGIPYKNGRKYIELVVSTPLKNISQNGNLPQIGMNINKYLSCHRPEMGLPGNWTRAWQLLQKGWKGGCPVLSLGGICSLVPGYIPETTVLGDVSPCWFDVWNKLQIYSYYMDVVVKCHGGLILSEIICWTYHLKKNAHSSYV